MLLEHTLLPSGEIAEAGAVYFGWPARRQDAPWEDKLGEKGISEKHTLDLTNASIVCPICRQFPKASVVTECGHLFCEPCITQVLGGGHGRCPVCQSQAQSKRLTPIFLSFRMSV